MLFAEPLRSKRSEEVLRGIQRIYSKITLMNLTVRRTHSDGGKEFTNRGFKTWCAARDIHPTYSPPGDPKANGRIENAVGRVKAGIRSLLLSAPELKTSSWPSALRQFVEQKFRESLGVLGGERPKRALPPFGARVMVQSRSWSKKTPYAPRAIEGIALCPASNISGCTVVLLPEQEGDKQPRFHVAPVAYTGVKDPIRFEADAVSEDPPLPPPSDPPVVKKRVSSKRPIVAHACVGGESGSDCGFEDGHDLKEAVLLKAPPDGVDFHGCGTATPIVTPPNSTADAYDVRSAGKDNNADDAWLQGFPVWGGQPGCPNREDALHALFSISECPVHQLPRENEEEESREESMTCRVCEEPVSEHESMRCSLCGLRASDKLSIEESEARAEQLLNAAPVLRREDVDQLIAESLWNRAPKTRKVDQSLQGSGTLGLTLGFYRYGPKVGVTKETLRRPRLTQVVNRYMQQEGARIGEPGHWCSVRVTSNFSSEIHQDRNEPGSLNFVVPVSRFGGGRIWIEEGFGQSSHSTELSGADVSSAPGKPAGRYVGGDLQSIWFDASRNHAVEASSGTRRVLVGYTPKELGRLPPDLREFLVGLSFPLPPPKPQRPLGETMPRTSEPEGPKLQEDMLSEPEIHQLRCEHVMLRHLLIEQHKCCDEEIAAASNEGRIASNLHLHDLCAWIEECEQGLVWQDTSDLLKSGAVGEAEAAVLGARLASLGVSSDVEEAQTWKGLYEDHDPEDPGSGGVGDKKETKISDPETQAWQAQPAQVLQTVAVSHAEVLKNVEEWRAPASEELGSIFDIHRTLRKITDEDVARFKEAGDTVEYLPSKALFQVKAGQGRKKVRVVACGNFAENAGSKSKELRFQNYAGGADTLSLRCHMKFAGSRAGTHGWLTSGGDIRTAFLLAPLVQPGHRKILKPPHTLVKAGIVDPSELWLVTGAIYGLQESPAAWATHRDSVIPTIPIRVKDQSLYLQRSRADANMWMLRCPHTQELLAVLSVYVDDLLLSADADVSAAVWEAIQKTWKISTPVFATEKEGLKFCGFEIHQDQTGLRVSQQAYIRSLLDKYPDIQGEVSVPYGRELETQETKPTSSIEKIRYAQALVGEILWIATRSRPDLSYAVSRIGQLITKDTEQAIQRAEDTVRYLRRSIHYELHYGSAGEGRGPGDQLPIDRGDNIVEVFADASFCPGTDKSQTGLIILWGNSPIAWLSMRQPCASLSTAEAELQSSLDGTLLYNDNQGACTVMNMPQGTWRTRHLRLKAAWFFEQLEHARFRVYHVPGQYMLGDLCTKPLQGVRVRDLLRMMKMKIGPSAPDGGESSSSSSASSVNPVVQKVVAGCADPGGEIESATAWSLGTGGAPDAAQALRVLTVASALQTVTAKLVHVSVDVEDHQSQELAELKTVLQFVCCVLTIVGVLALVCWCRGQSEEVPRIQALSSRVRDNERSEITDEDEWSMIDETRRDDVTSGLELEGLTTGPTTRVGLRNRSGYRSLAVPAPNGPKGSLTSRDDSCDDEGSRGATWVYGSRSLAVPASDDPRGSLTRRDDWVEGVSGSSGSEAFAVPAPMFPSGSSAPNACEGRRSEAGGGLLGLTGRSSTESGVFEVRGDEQPQGLFAVHVDDAAYSGSAEGAPGVDSATAGSASVSGDCDGVAEDIPGEPEHDIAKDVQEDISAEYVRTHRARETERERLEIYPGWPLRVPPRFSWDPKPEWGSWESLFYQNIPPAVKRDFYYHDRLRGVLVRFHAQERRQMFVPSPGGLPESVSWESLTGRRRTFHRGSATSAIGILEDVWNVPHPKPARQVLTEKWVGRTELELHSP